ncbi:helix-turn-helix domain-containing protein [Goodfellowiella coeruleoviolacea]|uniref:helix-turn-helix domain-containing protein n=1 Tax=Goodfellowiella coeruleoviolacea TaxID=334858 RepID=UPI0020A59E42|nr:XRE family transcriptional regulator [Goodfellowiella coeruleoviolacea]
MIYRPLAIPGGADQDGARVPDQEAVTRAIAANVRAARTARRWSLDTLASRSGVSKSVLVAVEQGKGNPCIGTLWRLSDAFGTTLARLVEVVDEPPLRVVEPDEGVALWQGADGGRGVLLLGDTTPPAELWDWRLRPGEEHHSEPHAPGTRELLHLIEGAVELRVAGSVGMLRAGGAAVLAGDQPHGYVAVGDEPCRFTMTVLVPPPLPE